MIQSLEQISSQVESFDFPKGESIYIQKIYSSSYFVCISLRMRGETKFLYIGRGAGNEGVWLSSHRVESYLRKIDKFLEYIRKHLGSSSFIGIDVDTKDRIISIKYFKWGRENRMYFFYNARNLYFANFFFNSKNTKMELYRSWTMKSEVKQSADFSIFDEVGRRALSGDTILNKKMFSIEELLKIEKDKARSIVTGGKSKKFLNRKLKRIEGDIKNTEAVSELKIIASSNQNLDKLEKKTSIKGIRLNFKASDHFNRRDEVYTKIKKLNKANEILKLRLKDTIENLHSYNNQSSENNLKTTAPVWKSQKNITKKSDNTKGKQYKIITFSNFKLGIGLSAAGNDQLRVEWAKKTDFWFHLDGDKSPHIILKSEKISLSEETLVIVGSALLAYSDFDYRQANLIYTQVKNLKGVTGATGKVIYKKEKRVRVDYDDNWSTGSNLSD